MSEESYTRTCRGCGESKDLAAFSRDRNGRDGRSSLCKECSRAKAKAWREKNPSQHRQQQKEYRRKYPKKYAARQALHQQVRRGAIVKPSACEKCHRTLSSELIHAHHPDYEKPLEVMWLCDRCHKAVHAEEAGLSKTEVEFRVREFDGHFLLIAPEEVAGAIAQLEEDTPYRIEQRTVTKTDWEPLKEGSDDQ